MEGNVRAGRNASFWKSKPPNQWVRVSLFNSPAFDLDFAPVSWDKHKQGEKEKKSHDQNLIIIILLISQSWPSRSLAASLFSSSLTLEWLSVYIWLVL